HCGHAKLPYSTIVTGAFGSPSTRPCWAMPRSCPRTCRAEVASACTTGGAALGAVVVAPAVGVGAPDDSDPLPPPHPAATSTEAAAIAAVAAGSRTQRPPPPHPRREAC